MADSPHHVGDWERRSLPSVVPGHLTTDHTFIFVGGLHRSGTSMLTRLLAGDAEVSTFRRTGVPEDEGQHLQTVYPTASQAGGYGRFGYSPQGHLTEASRVVSPANRRLLFAQWAEHWDLRKPFLLEKSPPNVIRSRFLQALFPRSYFVMVLRHPLVVALATQRMLKRRTGPTVDTLVRHWLHCHETMLNDADHVKNLVCVRYEDFVLDPYAHLKRLRRVLGLRDSPLPLEVAQGSNARYLMEWQARGVLPRVRLCLDAVLRAYDSRAHRFGYRLVRPSTVQPGDRRVLDLLGERG